MDDPRTILQRRGLEHIRLVFVGGSHKPVIEVDGRYIVFTDCKIWPDKIELLGRDMASTKVFFDRDILVISHEELAADPRLSPQTKMLIQQALDGKLLQGRNRPSGWYYSRMAYAMTLEDFNRMYEPPKQFGESA